jgi:hypothetical protein
VELEEARQEEEVALPEEVRQEEALQEEAPQGEDPQEEDNHPHNKPKQHNQYPSKPAHDMNLYAAQK